jgi:hypothetical protein
MVGSPRENNFVRIFGSERFKENSRKIQKGVKHGWPDDIG